MTPRRLDFDITIEDQVAAFEAMADHDEAIVRNRRLGQQVIGTLVGLLIVIQGVQFFFAEEPGWITPLAAVVFLLALCPTREKMRAQLRKTAAERSQSPEGQMLLGPRSMTFSPQGIGVTASYGSAHFLWTAVIDVLPTPGHLFLVLPGPSYYPVPREAFGSDAAFERFEQELQRFRESSAKA